MDRATYDNIWNTLVIPYFKKCHKKYGGLICPDSGYEAVFSYYGDLIQLAKSHYMSKQVKRLNRHKVSAAIMIAILKAKPIKKIDSHFYNTDEDGKPVIWPFNEALAITVGLSILCTFILQRAEMAFAGGGVSKKIFDGVCRQDSIIFQEGIPLEKGARSEWEWELYQVRQEGAYNLLAMAHILSDLEVISRLQYFNCHPNESPEFPVYSSDNVSEDDPSLNGFS